MSLRNTILLWSSALLIIVYLIISLIISSIMVNTIHANEVRNNSLYLNSTTRIIDNYLTDMARTSRFVFADTETQEIMKSWSSLNQIDRVTKIRYLKDLFINIIYARENIAGVSLLDNELTNVYTYNIRGGVFYIGTALDNAIIRQTVLSALDRANEPGNIVFGSYNTSSHATNSPSGQSAEIGLGQYYCFGVREIFQFFPYEKIGTIVLSIPVTVFTRDFKQDLPVGSTILLLDPNGVIAYADDESKLGHQLTDDYAALAESLFSGQTNFTYSDGDQEYFVSGLQSEYSGFSLVIIRETSQVYQDASRIQRNFLTVFLLSALAILLFDYFVIRRTTEPLKQLTHQMAHAEKNDFTTEIKVQGTSEIAVLSQTYNDLLERIRSLIESEYKTTIRLQQSDLAQKEYQLMYLRAQINPHFLYNTLNAIQLAAEAQNAPVVSEMILQLADFYRASVSESGDYVPLCHEIDLIKLYLALMKMRYPDIRDLYQIEDDAFDAMIPNFILQPIVENALYHGLKQNGYSGEIRIMARMTNDEICEIEICDDGVGMAENDMAVMNELLNNPTADSSQMHKVDHIGLLNISRRLYKFFGAKNRIILESNEPHGLCVRLLISMEVNHAEIQPRNTKG